tara:strand:+ start:313 stop:615 length:303 start_codon:yes stop_codon:yes gene_type:complete
MVRKKKIEVPNRKEGDPTGQTKLLEDQVNAVSPGQEIVQPPPVATPAPSPVQDIFNDPTQNQQEAGNVLGDNQPLLNSGNDIEVIKAVLLEKFPSLTSRF